MTNRKSTKRALLGSVMAMVLCLAMLVGATFAWFTDTASTGVNKIQAGNLDVQLVDENGNSLEGKTLEFKKAANAAEGEAVLWEPGCTYELPAVYVKNNGKLALKYKVVITGINGSAKLNEAIEWTIGDVAMGAEQHLAAGESNAFTIKGHMKESAGNEYMNESIDGIAITVVATQDTVESDSFDKDYDADAEYPVVAVGDVNTDGDTIEVNWIGTDTKSLYWKGTYQAPAAAGDWKWTSQGDTETMASALLASQDATKDFTYSEADGVSWETTALGTTITVKTVKQ